MTIIKELKKQQMKVLLGETMPRSYYKCEKCGKPLGYYGFKKIYKCTKCRQETAKVHKTLDKY